MPICVIRVQPPSISFVKDTILKAIYNGTDSIRIPETLGKDVQEICQISDAGRNLLKRAMEKFNSSTCTYDRILIVPQTIAELALSEEIKLEH